MARVDLDDTAFTARPTVGVQVGQMEDLRQHALGVVGMLVNRQRTELAQLDASAPPLGEFSGEQQVSIQAANAIETHGHGAEHLVAVANRADDVAVFVAAAETLARHRQAAVAIAALYKAQHVAFERAKVAVQFQRRASERIEHCAMAFFVDREHRLLP